MLCTLLSASDTSSCLPARTAECHSDLMVPRVFGETPARRPLPRHDVLIVAEPLRMASLMLHGGNEARHERFAAVQDELIAAEIGQGLRIECNHIERNLVLRPFTVVGRIWSRRTNEGHSRNIPASG